MNRTNLFVILLLFQSSQVFAADQKCTLTVNHEGSITDDCPTLHSCVEGLCIHKGIFPMTGREMVGAVLIMIFSGLANSGGIGGGGVMSPILLIIFGYDASKTIMLVYILIFGGSLGNFLNVAFQRDIQTGKPLVLYDFVMIVTPVMMLGSTIGVLLNKTVAPIITICGLMYLASTTFKKFINKAWCTYEKETQQLYSPILPEKSPKKHKDGAQSIEMNYLNESGVSDVSEFETQPELIEILKEENSFLPRRKIFFLFSIMAYVTLMTIVRGTEKFHSIIDIDYCSFIYWIMFLVTLLGCYMFYTRGVSMIKEKTMIKQKYNYKEDGYSINNEGLKELGLLGTWAGILAAFLGIGGGMIAGNPMLNMGIGPQAMTATCGLFVVMTSLMSLFQAFLLGGLTTEEIVFYFLISVSGSYTISTGISWIIKKYRRPSLLLFLLSTMLGITITTLPLYSIYKIIQNPAQVFSFHSLC